MALHRVYEVWKLDNEFENIKLHYSICNEWDVQCTCAKLADDLKKVLELSRKNPDSLFRYLSLFCFSKDFVIFIISLDDSFCELHI